MNTRLLMVGLDSGTWMESNLCVSWVFTENVHQSAGVHMKKGTIFSVEKRLSEKRNNRKRFFTRITA